MPRASEVPPLRDRLEIKVATSAPSTLPGGRVEVQVTLANQSVVDGDAAKALAYTGTPPALRIGFAGAADSLNVGGGELGAMLQVLNEDIPGARARLDDLAAGIVGAVNAAHRTGWSPGVEPAGDPPVAPPGWAGSNVDFFAPTEATTAEA